MSGYYECRRQDFDNRQRKPASKRLRLPGRGDSVNSAILVVDDEANIRELVRLYLQQEGFAVTEASDGASGIEAARALKTDLVILDLMMPGMTGWEVCRTLREMDIPVVMLTARGDEVDKVLGLELGADDYLTKPFSPRELVARVKAVLRRAAPRPAANQRQTEVLCLQFPQFTIDHTARTLTVKGCPVDCPPKEFDLLWLMAQNPNRAFTREHLLDKVWGYEFYGDLRTVDVHVQRLRKKIEPDPDNPSYIRTVWGVGYKFEGNTR
jgi:two-component system response regulator ResD